MAFSKLSVFTQISKTLAKPYRFRSHRPPPAALCFRFFSFATPEEAAAERRKRKRRLRIEPPLSSLRHQQQQQQRPSPNAAPQNPNVPKLPEPVSALSGNRLNLHNRILKLIRENDLEEAALYTRHSIYSNCRPTIYTCNAIMAAQLRQGKYAELLSLHRFITQAGIAANVVTHNLLLTTYLDCRKTELALEHYKRLINDAPFNPSPTTYRIVVKGLVDNQQVEKAFEIKEDMAAKGYKADPTVYSYLMLGLARNSNPDGILQLYEELKDKLGQEEILEGVIYGNLMKGYFLKGMEKEAMECYDKATGEGSPVKMSVMAYDYVLEALTNNGKSDLAVELFDRMKNEHNPPRKLTVDLGSYNVIVDGYCADKRFDRAIEVFNSMGEKRCNPDTLSYNVLIDQLCSNGMLGEAEELFKGMSDKKVRPDEYTFAVLMDTCFKENRPDDAAHYFKAMVESKLRPNMEVYTRAVEGLVKVGKVEEAKSIFDMMVPKLRMNDETYKFIMNALFDVGRQEDVLKIVARILREEPNDFTDDLQEYLRERLRKDGREEELTKLQEDIEREKAEAAAKAAQEAEAKARIKIDIRSLIPPKLRKKDSEIDKLEEEPLVATSGDAETLSTSVNGDELAGQEESSEEISGEITSADGNVAEQAVEAEQDVETDKQVTA